MFKAFGLFPSPGDNHIGEYVPYGWDRTDDRLRGLNWMNFVKEFGVKREQRLYRIISGQEPLGDLLSTKSGEAPYDIIVSILENRNQLELAVNIPNNGCISNLPNDAIVEIPAMVSRSGIHGLSMGPLPRGIASLCNVQVNVQDLCVEAAVTGDKDLALQALLIDPVVKDMDAAKKTLDEMLNVNKPYLPQFK
jgi:alpha-galactosidase